MRSMILAATILLGASVAAQTQPPQRVYGFFVSWSVYLRNYHIPDVPAVKLTHLIYAFAKIDKGRIALADPYADTQKFYPGDSWAAGALRGSFRRMQLLKRKHKHLKTLIAVGGGGASQGFSLSVSTAQLRQAFAKSIVDFIVKYEFDGVDIDWEYPGSGSNRLDPQNYTLFLAELRQQLTRRGNTLNKKFELTIDVPVDPVKLAKLELAKLSRIVDAMHLTSFDYFVPLANQANPVTHFGAPLYPVAGDPTPPPYSTDFNIKRTIDLYMAAKVPPSLLILGMPLYGRGYGGVSGGRNGLFAKHTGPTTFGTWEAGIFDYTDLAKQYVNQNGYTRNWNDSARAPYVYSLTAKTMISYEDQRSIREKCWFLQTKKLGGAMLWELSGDRAVTLIGQVDQVLRRQPRLSAPTTSLSVSSPSNISLTLNGGTTRAGKLYVMLGTMSGTFPGLPLGPNPWPVNMDAFTSLMLSLLNTPVFPRAIGFTDAQGNAAPALGLGVVSSLPSGWIGLHVSLSAWVFDRLDSISGTPTNAVDIFFAK